MITLEDILQVVSNVTNVTTDKIRMGRHITGAKNEDIVFARQLFMFFGRRYLCGSQQMIGRFVGRDHATVVHACRTVQNDIDTCSARRAIYNKIDVELLVIDRLDESSIIKRYEILEEWNFDYPSNEISAELLTYQIPR